VRAGTSIDVYQIVQMNSSGSDNHLAEAWSFNDYVVITRMQWRRHIDSLRIGTGIAP